MTYLHRDETIQGPRRLSLLHTTIQARIYRRHDPRAQSVHGHFGIDRHLLHDRLAQHAVALPVVARMGPAAMQLHPLDERGLAVEQLVERRETRAERNGVPVRGRGGSFRVRRGRRCGGACRGVCGWCWCWRTRDDSDDDRNRAGARVGRLSGQRRRGRPRRAGRPTPGRTEVDPPPFLAFEAESFRVHEGETGDERHPVWGGIGFRQI